METEKKIILASPRGFCAGVYRAIEIVDISLKLFGTPLYVHHQIVHNKHVVDGFLSRGVKFVESLEDIPDNVPVIFSAHGVSPQIRQRAAEKHLKVIDATCPLVTKVHLEAVRYARMGFHILFIGHKNHVETMGTFGEAPDKIIIIENPEDIEKLQFDSNTKLVYLTQTTLSIFDTQAIVNLLKEKFPGIQSPSSSDICYATTNRQEAALKIANTVDMVLVIGSSNSSNSNRLKELAEKHAKPAFLIDNADNIYDSWFTDDIKTAGITAGASAPEELVVEVVQTLKQKYGFTKIEEVIVKEENTVFQLPSVLL
jgi:4-hydroxy-3-methylbut-2-enyl diphosphate reductase